MAATSTNIKFGPVLSEYGSLDAIGLDSSYPTGGYAVPSTIPLSKVQAMIPAGMNTSGQGYVFTFNQQTTKMQMFWGGGSAAVLGEVSGGTSLSGVTATVLSLGY